MGVTAFSGMSGVTLFGLVMTPVFYVALRKRRKARQDALLAEN
jgi:multidrug efflux pump subunit AcrB